MKNIDKYFDKFTFASLALILPATLMIISILLRAFDADWFYRLLFDNKNKLNTNFILNFSAVLSLVISFGNIVYLNTIKTGAVEEILFIQKKSIYNTAVMFVNISYVSFIYLYLDLEKLGNIPVGRN